MLFFTTTEMIKYAINIHLSILLAYCVATIMLWTLINSVERLACVRLTVIGHAFIRCQSREARQKRASVLYIIYNKHM